MTPQKIRYDGSKESINYIIATCERVNVNAFLSTEGIVVGNKDEQLIKKGHYFHYLLTVKD